ncbi:MAG: hypothetical protein FJ290_25820 [Planctomycetes bacterium]|nr:hypothetical protein [Planctomycetota bacterium]
MAMPSWMMVLMVLLSRGGGNDLLDYMPTDAYWRVKGVAITVERMAAQLEMGDPPDTSPAKAVRRLMAIRALGELKKAEALPALRPLLDSKELFAADYAREAIAAIEGKAFQRPRPTEAALWSDLCLLPPRCGIVAQMRTPARGPIPFDQLLKDAETVFPPMLDPRAAVEQWAKLLVTVAERTGNVRLDAMTLGVAEKLDDRTGFLVAVGRGLCDPDALKAALRQAGATAVGIEGTDVLTLQRLMIFPCSNDRLVLVLRATEEETLTKELVAAVRRGGDQPSLAPEMVALVQPLDRSVPAWGAVRMSAAYRQMPALVPFDTLTLTSREGPDGALAFTLVGAGKDPAVVQGAAALLAKDIAKTAGDLKAMAAQMPVLKAPAEFLGSIAIKTEEGKATLTGTLKGGPSVLLVPMVFHGLAEPGATEATRERDTQF